MNQKEANELCEGTLVDVADNISYFMVFLMTCIFYSPILPVAIPIALIGSIMMYFANKYSLLNYVKMPDMFSTMMATFFANFMPFVILTWSISYITFISKINSSYGEQFQEALEQEDYQGRAEEKLDNLQQQYTDFEYSKLSNEDNSYTMAICGLLFTIVCIILPIRMLVFYLCFDKGEGENGQEYQS